MQEHEPQHEGQPKIVEKSFWPPGNVPANRQYYALAAVAVLVLGTIFFSGAGNPTPKPVAKPAESPVRANEQVQQYKAYLAQQEAMSKLQQDQVKRGNTNWTALNQQAEQGYGIPGQPIVANGQAYYPVQQEHPETVDPIEQEKRKREYQSLFASNVALSYRAKEAKAAPAESKVVAHEKAETPHEVASHSGSIPEKSGHKLFEGTVIESVLTNRLEGQFSGPVNVQITTDVYSHDGLNLLIPKGTRVLGEAKQVSNQDQQRLAVVFHRLIMPDGFSVDLDDVLGLDQAGASALKDKINHHYLATFGTSIALGLLAGFSMAGTQGVYTGDGSDIYRQGVSSQLSRSSQQILQRQLNRLPDITIREGHRVKILLNADLSLPAFKDHKPVEGI